MVRVQQGNTIKMSYHTSAYKKSFFMRCLGGKEYIKHRAVIGITQMFLPKASSPLMIKLSIETVMKNDRISMDQALFATRKQLQYKY